MPNSALAIDERQVGDVTVLTLVGEILLDDGDLAFRQQIHDLLARECRKFVVDLGGVTHVDSSGVGMLVGKLKTVREKGGDMKLVHVTPRSHRLLGLLKVHTLFEVFDDEAAAVKSFAWNG